MPRVSVILPVFNGERYLGSALGSILAQTFRDLECIVVNDGSTDGTAALARSFADPRLRLIEHERNLGIVASLNRGMSEAGGTYICRMDADDEALPDRIAKQAGFLDRNPHVALCGTNTVLIDASGREIGREMFPPSTGDIRRTIFVHNPFAHSSVMIRASILRQCGFYDPRFLHNEDYDLWLRIAADHDMANLPEPLIRRRVHETSISAARETELSGFRVKTLAHAMVSYYRNPLLFVYLIRPVAACLYRLMKRKGVG